MSEKISVHCKPKTSRLAAPMTAIDNGIWKRMVPIQYSQSMNYCRPSSGSGNTDNYGTLPTLHHPIQPSLPMHSRKEKTGPSLTTMRESMSSGRRRRSTWSLCSNSAMIRACSFAALTYSRSMLRNEARASRARPITGRNYPSQEAAGRTGSRSIAAYQPRRRPPDYGCTRTI